MLSSLKRLSHSALDTFNTCERKFQIERLLSGYEREDSEHTVFGKAFGAGVATYLVTKDRDAALLSCWMQYWPIEESLVKDQARCLLALLNAFTRLDSLLENYEVAYFNNAPAVELGFRLLTASGYHYVGFIDVVLRNKHDGQYVIFECKTTGLALLDLSPLYKHSGQATGYSIALDRIAGEELASYEVLYFVAQLGKEYNKVNIHVLTFQKTLLDRLHWFISLGLDIQRLLLVENCKVYPRRGSNCLQFMRPCAHFGVCHLSAHDSPRKEEADTREYPFEYNLEDLVQDHLLRIDALDKTQLVALEAPVEDVGMYG